MPLNLLALCGAPGSSVIKRVRTSADVQNKLDGLFDGFEAIFRNDVEIERLYDSRWTPGLEELTTLPIGVDVQAILDRLQAGILTLDEIDGSHFDLEQIRGLAVLREQNGIPRLLVQVFSAAQKLARKFAFISNGNTFDRLDQSAFVLSNKIDAIVEGGNIKFKNFFNAKKIFAISSHYREATDAEIRDFAQSSVLHVDSEALIEIATQPIRKLISSIQASGVLNRETAASIRQKSQGLVPVVIENDKVVIPLSKRELKDLMAFLDHKIYRSPVDDDPYETNSHRRRGG